MGPPSLPLRSLSHARLSARSSFAMTGHAGSPNGKAGQSTTTDVQVARCLGSPHPKVPRLPSLMEICLRVLLEPEEGDLESGKMLLEQFESGCLVNLNKNLDGNLIKSLEAARRSAVKAWGRVRPASTTKSANGTWCSGIESDALPTRRVRKPKEVLDSYGLFANNQDSVPASMDFLAADEEDGGEASNEWSGEEEKQTPRRVISIEEQLDQGDDSKQNPWFNRCPNPRHYPASSSHRQSSSSSSTTPFDWPGPIAGGRIFSKSSVSRLEWVSHVAGISVAQVRLDEVQASQGTETPTLALGTNCIPLQWRGCSSNCLDFLE